MTLLYVERSPSFTGLEILFTHDLFVEVFFFTLLFLNYIGLRFNYIKNSDIKPLVGMLEYHVLEILC